MLTYTCIFILGLIYYFIGIRKNKSSDKKTFFLFFMIIATFVGFGDMIGGYDRYIYGEVFDTIADETWTGRNYTRLLYLKNGIEWGYFGWQILLSYITENRYIFIFISTLTVYLLYYKAFIKYFDDYPLVNIVFLGFLYYFTMTYLREVIAIGIAWQGVNYIWQRKPIKFFLIMALAATFHTSILIFAIMYFIPRKRYSKSSVIRFLTLCLLIGTTSLPISVLSTAGDATMKGNYTDETQGFRIEYIIEVIFIIWVIFKNYRIIPKDKKTLTFINMSYALCGVLLFFMRFGQGGRFGWPFFLGLFYTFPKICDSKKAPKNLKAFIIIVCFALFMRITITWGPINLLPYKTFLTDGIPSAPNVYERYEYDRKYTLDKFYRPAFAIKHYEKK